MSKLKNPPLNAFKTITCSPRVGICIPVYASIGNDGLPTVLYGIEQCCDLPYQLSVGLSPNSVAKNRIKAEARLSDDIRYVIHMDDDIVLPPFFASKLVQVLQSQDNVGAVSAVMMGVRGQAQNDLHPDAVPPGEIKETTPPGTCFAYDRKKTPVEWDTAYLGSQWEDTDAMRQIQAQGYKTVATGNVVIMHKNNWSENKHWNENKAHFEEKWNG